MTNDPRKDAFKVRGTAVSTAWSVLEFECEGFPRTGKNTIQPSIRDLTNLLDVAESTVSRWIKQRGLPATAPGCYRVNRAELLEWATANGVRVSLELFDHLEADPETIPSLSAALQAGGSTTISMIRTRKEP